MEQKKLDEILQLHKMWLNGEEEGERANLRGANMRGTNMRGADMRGANLQRTDLRGTNMQDADMRDADVRDADVRGTNMRGANMRGTNMRGDDVDYSCWPLWCGSLDVQVDRRIAAQLAYHFCRLDCDDPDYIEARNAIVNFANEFHRVEECGWLELKEVKHV